MLGDKTGIHPELLKIVGEQQCRTAEDTARGNNLVARLQEAGAGRVYGGHPGRCRHTTFAALQRREAFLETTHCGIGKTGVDVARLVTAEAGCRRRGALEHIAGCREYRFGMFQFGRSMLTGANRERLESERLIF